MLTTISNEDAGLLLITAVVFFIWMILPWNEHHD